MAPESGEGRAVRVRAPAKVNLYLHVLGRGPDGYHELDSLVAFPDIADIVTARPGAGLSLAVDGPFATALNGDPEGNLVLRAARLLAREAGVAADAALALTKNLPVASGIGGGSSDAAAALRALCRLWRVRPGEARLREIAGALGADVPACLLARPAWLAGIGERIAPAGALPRLGIVLVNPLRALPTPAVFAARRGAFSALDRPAALPAAGDALLALLRRRRNDLTDAAIGILPEIAAILEALAAEEGILLSRMSGSGATCFALCADARTAGRVARRLAAARPGWWVRAGRLDGNRDVQRRPLFIKA